jgi:hypothetical protein
MLIFRLGVSQPVSRLEWTLASRVLAVRIDALNAPRKPSVRAVLHNKP